MDASPNFFLLFASYSYFLFASSMPLKKETSERVVFLFELVTYIAGVIALYGQWNEVSSEICDTMATGNGYLTCGGCAGSTSSRPVSINNATCNATTEENYNATLKMLGWLNTLPEYDDRTLPPEGTWLNESGYHWIQSEFFNYVQSKCESNPAICDPYNCTSFVAQKCKKSKIWFFIFYAVSTVFLFPGIPMEAIHYTEIFSEGKCEIVAKTFSFLYDAFQEVCIVILYSRSFWSTKIGIVFSALAGILFMVTALLILLKCCKCIGDPEKKDEDQGEPQKDSEIDEEAGRCSLCLELWSVFTQTLITMLFVFACIVCTLTIFFMGEMEISDFKFLVEFDFDLLWANIAIMAAALRFVVRLIHVFFKCCSGEKPQLRTLVPDIQPP